MGLPQKNQTNTTNTPDLCLENGLIKFFNKIKNSHNFPHLCNKILKMINLVRCVSIMDNILVTLKSESVTEIIQTNVLYF